LLLRIGLLHLTFLACHDDDPYGDQHRRPEAVLRY
jgi:hypothetical protein